MTSRESKRAHKLVSESEIDLVGSCRCRRAQRGFKPPQSWLIVRAAAIIANITLYNKCSPKKSSSPLWEWYKHTRILPFHFVVLTQLLHTRLFPAGSYLTYVCVTSSKAADDLMSLRKAKTAGTSRPPSDLTSRRHTFDEEMTCFQNWGRSSSFCGLAKEKKL